MGRVLAGRRIVAHPSLDDFFGARLPLNREGTDWEKVVRILTIYRLLNPGSEWRLHRHWFATTALATCSR